MASEVAEAGNTDRADITAAWLSEVKRRLDEYASGDTQLIDAEDHFARIRARLAARDHRFSWRTHR